MSTKIVMSVGRLVEMRDDLQLAVNFIKQDRPDKAQVLLEELLEAANETLGRV